MKWVLDTGFFLAGMDPASLEGQAIICPEIRDEVAKGLPGKRMEYFLEGGLIVMKPSDDSISRIRAFAELTGDSGRLSSTDISVMALAMEQGATVLTDDYSIQNVCRKAGIEYRSISEKGIKEVWVWEYRCTGCRRRFKEPVQECPVCGSPVKTVRSRSR